MSYNSLSLPGMRISPIAVLCRISDFSLKLWRVFASDEKREEQTNQQQQTVFKLYNLAGYGKRKRHHSPPFLLNFSEMRSPSSSTIFAISISTFAVCSNGFGIVPFTSANSIVSRLSSATTDKPAVETPPSFLGWDTHQPVSDAPSSLVRENDGPEGNFPMRARFEKLCRDAQISITKAIEEIDGEGKFKEDCWVRPNGGGGMSRVLSGGKVFEKAGVNLSVVYGTMPQEALKAATERGIDRAKGMAPGERVPFFACGLSSVMHPKNPHCPTMHFNYRYFETDGGVWWFGGGTDITPCYVNEEDMKQFHGVYKDICDKHDPKYYDEFKAWADKYFVIQHRGETRGLGGIFFDDQNDRDPDKIFEFSKECLNNVVNAYGPIIQKHKNDEYTPEQKEWQLIRRGRYVEFNLVYDRGTVFGLKTGGRIESILMSLPETARWEYDHHPNEGSPEAEFLDACRNPRSWV